MRDLLPELVKTIRRKFRAVIGVMAFDAHRFFCFFQRPPNHPTTFQQFVHPRPSLFPSHMQAGGTVTVFTLLTEQMGRLLFRDIAAVVPQHLLGIPTGHVTG